MLFSDFHVQPTCSPTRSSLLTGRDKHVAGLGIMEEFNYPAFTFKTSPGIRPSERAGCNDPRGDSATIHSNDGMGYELFEMKTYIKENWQILRLRIPFATGQWQLYNLEGDGETTDLSAKFPQVREELINDRITYTKQNEV